MSKPFQENKYLIIDKITKTLLRSLAIASHSSLDRATTSLVRLFSFDLIGLEIIVKCTFHFFFLLLYRKLIIDVPFIGFLRIAK